MKIGIVSDTHGSVPAWERAWERCLHDSDVIIHAGDVLYHGPKNPLPEGYDGQGLATLLNGVRVPLLIARGNCDAPVDQMVLRAPLQSPYLFAQLGSWTVMANHGDCLTNEDVQELSYDYSVTLFIVGHTHIPSLRRVGDALLLNPGSPSLPKSEQGPTLGVVEESRVRLVRLESGEVIDEMAMPAV